MSEEHESKARAQVENDHGEWQGIKDRIDCLHDLEVRYSDLRLELMGLKRTQEAIKYGWMAAGLEGSNEKAREAYLQQQLSEDTAYVQAFARSQETEAELAHIGTELTYQKRLYSLDLLTTFGPANVGISMEVLAEAT